MKTILFLTFVLSYSQQLLARNWQKIVIPGAKCANGSDYSLFYSQGDSSKLAIEFMGGGACWSQSTCKGPNLRTWIYPIPKIPAFSHFSSDGSILGKHTFIYLPYCTGDVFSGNHDAEYKDRKFILHWGKRNIQLALEFITQSKLDPNRLQELIVFGSSAGGIGSLIHSKNIADHFPKVPHKKLIADSVGLHFGDQFWNKFTENQIHDFDDSFKNIFLDVNFSTGFIAPALKKFCDYTPWKVLFIQSTRDVIMSSLFGDIAPEEHEKRVLGPHGMRQVLKDHQNCKTFISNGSSHAYMIIKSLMEDTRERDSQQTMYQQVVDFMK